MKTNRFIQMLLCALGIVFLASCNTGGDSGENPVNNKGGDTVPSVSQVPDAADILDTITALKVSLSGVDTTETWTTYTDIALADGATVITGTGATVAGDLITISDPGTYMLSGTLTDGQVHVNDVGDNVYLILNGANITCSNSAPLAIFGSKKKVVTLAPGTTNYLTDGSVYTVFYNSKNDEPNGTLFAKKALTINGTGTLYVNGNFNNGISCKDNLVILNATVIASSPNNALKGNDSIIIKDADVTLTSDADGMKSDSDDDGLGYVYIDNSSVTITAVNDGIDAFRSVRIAGGVFDITTGGGSNAVHADDDSRKAIKSDMDMLIEGGTFNINAYEDALRSKGSMVLSGGTMNLSSANAAVRAEDLLLIDGADITITKSTGGFRAKKIVMNDGDANIISSGYGIYNTGANVADPENTTSFTVISGGDVSVNAVQESFYSPGVLQIAGGKVSVHAPVDPADEPLSVAGLVINGGTLAAPGPEGNVIIPAKNSEQPSVLVTFNTAVNAGDVLELKNAGGTTLVNYTAARAYNSILISELQLVSGSSYSIALNGSQVKTFKMSGKVLRVSVN
ncbi:carbohydrate-binding domain-containing protein [Brucepastera parasyntrophica]|uniref:carbohydrate-binding domain-containing protein n=1 Tax=Brucepastera parasyntrophica TaxID=2880008 RepID=UPI00210DC84A|nr:carbohydrate-binding domain-containing protein [Brucepastera parasyntrophica]ULQ59512.1 carbohydrate-binding domain-containing protein [Brucepastera parasyntrophica]